jgi:hypothetical protein
MHRALAATVEQPELRARHLALAASSADPSTLHALDAAAEVARARGAPAAAAELVDLAINLGADKPVRRIRRPTITSAQATPRAYGLISRRSTNCRVDRRATALNLLAAMRINDDGVSESIELLNRARRRRGRPRRGRTEPAAVVVRPINSGRFGEAVRRVPRR